MNPAIRKLLSWYRRNARRLPWRNKRDAYRIFISEIMLHQTQVDRVIPKYREWLKRFPSWRALAQAKTSEIIHAWAGLGYNRRALYTRDAAKMILANGVPQDEAAWRALPGIGPYTAAALSVFVNDTHAIVIDTNVRRVAGRIFLGIPHPGLDDDERIRRVLETVTPRHGRRADLPQAFMDFGSAICTGRAPACATCPLRQSCKAAPRFLEGSVERRTALSRERRHRDKPYPDRIYRGRILALARENNILSITRIGPLIDDMYDEERDATWVSNMVTRLVRDGLLNERRGKISLP